jgi:hypothetical protein
VEKKAATVGIVGLTSHELEWVRLLLDLLRHQDPVTAELSKQALLYVKAHPAPGTSDIRLYPNECVVSQ